MIRKLKNSDILQVAGIHKAVLSGFLPELGEEFLQAFYRNSLNIPELFTYVETENDHINGFITGIMTPEGLYKKIIFQDIKHYIILLLKHLITHPFHFVKMLRVLAYPGFSDNIPELLTIAVSKKKQGRGIGRKLFNKIVREFRKRKVNDFRVSVYDRLPSNGFYKKIGCRLDSSFEFLGEKMNYYSFSISLHTQRNRVKRKGGQ